MTGSTRRRDTWPWLLLALVVCALAYGPGIDGAFVFDSVPRILGNEMLALRALHVDGLLQAAFAGERAYPERGLANLSFALNHLLSGGRFSPAAFKLTNLLVHLLNALLLFALLRRLVDPRLALLAVALWVLHPLQLTTVLYAVQRMTGLSATFVLIGLCLYVAGRRRLASRPAVGFALMLGAVALGAGVGFLAKQNALLMPLFAALIEFFFLSRDELPPGRRRGVVGFHLLLVGLPGLAGVVLLIAAPESVLSGYAARDFTLAERLLTQSRVLLHYLGLLVAPLPGSLSLFHDDLLRSTGVLSPPQTLACLVFWAATTALVLGHLRARPLWGFAIAWFVCGHLMESTILPLEMAHEHRNYVPSMGVCLLLAAMLRRLGGALRLRPVMASLLAALMLAGFAGVVAQRAADWRDPARLAQRLLQHHPDSYRSVMLAYGNAPLMPADRLRLLAVAAGLGPGEIRPLLALLMQLPPPASAMPPALAAAVAVATGRTRPPHRDEAWSALTAAVGARLRDHALSTGNAVALVEMTDCAIAGAAACRTLRPQLAQWLRAVLRAGRSNDINFTAVHLSLAKLAAAAGEVDAALAHARGIRQWTPDSPSYRLLEVELALRLGRREQAAVLLMAVERDLGWRVRAHRRYALLRTALSSAGAQS